MPKLRWFRNPFRKLRSSVKAELIDPSSGGHDVERDEIYTLIKEQLGEKVVLILGDRDYYAMDEDVLKRIAQLDGTDAMPYIAEGFDCDDFTRVFLGRLLELNGKAGNKRAPAISMAIGYFDVGKEELTEFHMMILFVARDGENLKLRLYEPQNDKFFDVGKSAVTQVIM